MGLAANPLVFTTLLLPAAAQAQDDFPIVGWGPMMQTETMNSAMTMLRGRDP